MKYSMIRLRSLRKDVWIDLLFATLAFGLFCLRNNDIPGFHLDESWVLLRTKSILEGERPLKGMNFYTGALHQYLLAPWLAFLGVKITTLRAFSALTAASSLFLGMRLLRRVSPSPNGDLGAALVLVTFPVLHIDGRQAIELVSINLLLATASVFLLVTLGSRRKAAILAGLLQGLGLWSHILFASVIGATVGTFGLLWLVRGLRARSWRVDFVAVALYLAGIAAGDAPQWLSWSGNLAQNPGDAWNIRAILEDLPYLPGILQGILNGPLLYRRYAGVTQSLGFPFFTFALLGTLVLRLRDRVKITVPELSTLSFTFFLITGTILLVPHWSDRYFHLPAIATAGVLLVFSAGLSRRRVAVTSLVLLAVIQASQLLGGFYQPFLKDGGNLGRFNLGNRLSETSDHFVQTEPLHRHLHEEQVQSVYGESFIVYPFWSLNLLQPPVPRLNDWNVSDEFPSLPGGRTAFLFYRDRFSKQEHDRFTETLVRKYPGHSVRDESARLSHFDLWFVD